MRERHLETVVRIVALVLICILAFAVRLFAVVRFESVITQFDPYFNFRSTNYLVTEGFQNFVDWFDESAWYPLGRIIGGTVYPGLMATAAGIHWTLNVLNLSVDLRSVCVYLAPFFASTTALLTYFLTKEIRDADAGLVAAALIAICPGYVSRSVAGSYDNEGIAVFAMLLTFLLFIKGVKTGKLVWSGLCALSYLYLVSAWGGYIFVINLIPLYVVAMLAADRYSHRLYVAYNVFYILGTVMSMQISTVGFQAVQSWEHLAALAVFGLLQFCALLSWVRHLVENDVLYFKFFNRAALVVSVVAAGLVGAGVSTGFIAPLSGRFLSLLDPTYAKANLPLTASVSNHQPTTWSSFYFDLHLLCFLFPVGMYFCFKTIDDGTMFIIVYAVTALYFAGVMVRLMLVLAPVACILGGIAISATMQRYVRFVKHGGAPNKRGSFAGQYEFSVSVVLALGMALCFYTTHCNWVTQEAYSNPSIVLTAKQPDGSRVLFDDFREAYLWLRHNTKPDAKIMSWWDYGYQIAAMANRTVLVDNNAWNNTHTATVGRALASSEEEGYKIMVKLDVDYVLVIFGGLTGYGGDDINKFLWMLRVGGGVFPQMNEADYFYQGREFKVDKNAPATLYDSLMYKLSYYRFGHMHTDASHPRGFDRARNVEIGHKDIQLEHLEEAFTSDNWIVRIYKVKQPNNRA